MAYSEVIDTNKKDNLSVTYTKAIGIILVVLAHAMCPSWTVWLAIYSFHMPLFFIMSGYCFKEKYLDDFKSFVFRKFKGIYLPFVLYSLAYLFLHNFFVRHNLYAESLDIYDWKWILRDIIRITTRMSQSEQFLWPFWFLKELMWGNMIFYAFIRLFKNRKMLTIGVLLLLALVFRFSEFMIPYFKVSYVSFYSAMFIAIGYWIKGWRQIWNMSWRWLLYTFCLLVVVVEVMFFKTSILGVDVMTMLPFMLSGCAGTLLLLRLSSAVAKFNVKLYILEYIGNHTMVIYAMHMISFKLASLLIIMMYDLPITRLTDYPMMLDYSIKGWWIAYTLAGVFLPILFSICYECVKSLFLRKKCQLKYQS